MMAFILAALLSVLLGSTGTHAHFRTLDPVSRNPSPGLKNWPCGGDAFGSGTKTALAPGLHTVILEETIDHSGAPFRFSLSIGNDDLFQDLILYDHLPHNDQGSGTKQYAFNLTIPDINCPNCALQVINPMTDKIQQGTCCPYKTGEAGECFSVYHQCSDISISGSQDPATWAASVASPLAGRCGPYTQEATAAWTRIPGGNGNRWGLQGYTGPVGDTCGSVACPAGGMGASTTGASSAAGAKGLASAAATTATGAAAIMMLARPL